MKRKRFFVAGMLAALTFGIISAGCDNATSPGSDPGDPGTRAFYVSGSFTKTGGAGSGGVKFDLTSNAASSSASIMGRAITADSYTIGGVVDGGDLTIRVKGSYDPNTGIWSVSGKSDLMIYTLDGSVNSAGVSQGTSATLAIKSGDEWIPYIFPVKEEVVSITGTPVDSLEGGVPSFGQGYWYANMNHGGGYSTSLSVLISEWRVKVTGTSTSPGGSSPIEDAWTLIECRELGNGTYEIIGCYPEYEMTQDNYIKAGADYLDIDSNNITVLTTQPGMDGQWPSGRWVYVSDDGSTWMGGFSQAEYKKLEVFWATGGWEKWAASHSVPPENRYVKAKITYNSSKTSFDMVNMVAVANHSAPWNYTSTFSSLAALKEATLVEAQDWEWSANPPTSKGVDKITFRR
jgi:hypothetical protein